MRVQSAAVQAAASALAILAVTITITGAGGAVASASQDHARAEQLRIMSTKATATSLSVIATGAVTAGGTDLALAKRISFPGGTFKLRLLAHSVTASFDPFTCLLTETQKGTFVIGHGSGRYARIHGSGRYVTAIIGVTAKNRAGDCVHVQAPATFQQITTATGTVSG
jgi:hypothetical protein